MRAPQHIAGPGWQPVWWEPVLWDGADLMWAADLTADHTISGGEVILDGHRTPLTVRTRSLSARVPASVTDQVPAGAAAAVYLDLADGRRVIWMRGRVTRGEQQ